MSSIRLRLLMAVSAVLLFGWFTVANFIPVEQRLASPLLPDFGLRLGLDLQGGIHWVLGVKLDVAEQQELDFLSQEMLREVNTLGSKARDTSTSSLVVDMKLAIEQFKEQLQNVE